MLFNSALVLLQVLVVLSAPIYQNSNIEDLDNLNSTGYSSTSSDDTDPLLPHIEKRQLEKRNSKYVEAILVFNGFIHTTPLVQFGSGKQKILGTLDTGSSDVWVPAISTTKSGSGSGSGSSSLQKSSTSKSTDSTSSTKDKLNSIVSGIFGSKSKRGLFNFKSLTSSSKTSKVNGESSSSSSSSSSEKEGTSKEESTATTAASHTTTAASSSSATAATAAALSTEGPATDPLRFDASKSTTFKDLKTSFSIMYAEKGTDGQNSYAKGSWAKDTLTVDGHAVNDVAFGYVTATTQEKGYYGIGAETDSIAAGSTLASAGLLNSMKTHKLISKKAYSFYMGGKVLGRSYGLVLFGGTDKAKYEGNLQMFSTVKNEKKMMLELDSITVEGKKVVSSSSSGSGIPTLIDSGASYIYVPKEHKLFNYGTTSDGHYLAPCNSRMADLEFSFGGSAGSGSKTIKVPFSDILIPEVVKKDSDGASLCQVAVEATTGETHINLGVAFMKSAYVYFDMEESKIGIAQAKGVSSLDDLFAQLFV